MRNISTVDSVSEMPSEDLHFYIGMAVVAVLSAMVVLLA